MATNYPTSKQTFTNPSAGDPTNSPSHAGLHADLADTVEAIQDVIGTGSGLTLSDTYAPASPARAKVYQTSGQSISISTWTPLEFDAEEYDTDGFHDNATNNTRLTAPEDGFYLVGGAVKIDSAGVAQRNLLKITKNGVDITGANAETESSDTGSDPGLQVVHPVVLSAGDYVELEFLHTSNVARSTKTAATAFWIVK